MKKVSKSIPEKRPLRLRTAGELRVLSPAESVCVKGGIRAQIISIG